MKNNRFYAKIILVVLLTAAAASPAFSQEEVRTGEIIDRIIAVVEDRAVLQSDVELEYKRILMQMQRSSMSEQEAAETRKQILDGLVADLLMMVHAEKMGLEVADTEVDEQLEAVIGENKRTLGGEDAFKRQLEREGMTLAQLRDTFSEKIRARMVIERLLRREVMSDVQVTEAETRDYYKKNLADLPLRPATVMLAHILIRPAASEKALEAARQKIADVERRLRDGQDFAELAKEFSDDPSAGVGGSLGYVNLEDLNSPAFEGAVHALSIGEVSEPVLTKFGYHLIKLEDVRGDERLIRHILAMVESGEEDIARAAQKAEEVRRQLIAGADFSEMAARYSDDPGTKNAGGVVGEIAAGNLPEFFRDVVADVGIGEIAPVIKEKSGFRIVKVLGRAPERQYTFEEAREELKKLIDQQKRQNRFQEYVENLKGIYYVEVKGAQGE